MKKLSYLLMVVIAIAFSACGQIKTAAYYDQASRVIAVNQDGTYAIRTQVRSRNAAIAFTDAQRQVVVEALFKGFAPASNGINRVDPILTEVNVREKNEEYFNAFLSDNGDWKKYVSFQDKRTGSTTYMRTHSQSVETVTVSLDRAALKTRMVADGIAPAGNKWTM